MSNRVRDRQQTKRRSADIHQQPQRRHNEPPQEKVSNSEAIDMATHRGRVTRPAQEVTKRALVVTAPRRRLNASPAARSARLGDSQAAQQPRSLPPHPHRKRQVQAEPQRLMCDEWRDGARFNTSV